MDKEVACSCHDSCKLAPAVKSNAGHSICCDCVVSWWRRHPSWHLENTYLRSGSGVSH